ncbi:hypothetical protein JCM8547_008939 [Rhodosporidiobolus lusitaniae]
MRPSALLLGLVALVPLPSLVLGGSNNDLDVTVQWPKNNPFTTVQNGVSTNALTVRVSNHAGQDITLTGVRGEFREAGGKERTLRKTTVLALKQPVGSGQKSPLIPYRFHSENKIGEVGLRIHVDYLDSQNKKHSVLGYDDVVNVVEPPTSWFDLQLLSVYFIVLGALSGLGYLAYTSLLAPASKKSSKLTSTHINTKKSTAVVATSDVIDGTMSEVEKKLDEDWIPSHHKKRVVAVRERKGYVSGTSGDESEGGKKGRKGRK